MVYVHSAVGFNRRGALRIFREIYIKAGPERQANCVNIHIIQPSNFVKARMFMAEKCSKEARKIFDKIFSHKKYDIT